MMFDLDHFKRINDTYGHHIGDSVPATTAKVVVRSLRETDIPGRYSGEEFCVLLTNTVLKGAECVAQKLLSNIAAQKHRVRESQLISVSCSIGVAEFREKDGTRDSKGI